MGGLQSFFDEIEAIRGIVQDVRTRVAQSAASLDQITKADSWTGEPDFDVENARLQDVIARQRLMEEKVSGFIIRLEDAATRANVALNGGKRFSFRERLAAVVSMARMRGLHEQRVHMMQSAGNVKDVLAASDAAIGILKEHRAVLTLYFKRSEANLVQIIGRRKGALASIESLRKRIGRTGVLFRDFKHRLDEASDRAARKRLEAERAALATEYARMQAMEQQHRNESQTLALCIATFERFVDGINSQIADQNTLINKLLIDTEQCILLHKAMVESPRLENQSSAIVEIDAADQTGAARKGNGLRHIDGLLEMSEKNMLTAQDILRRKTYSDDAFARRFLAVADGAAPVEP